MKSLWDSSSLDEWSACLLSYDAVIDRQGVRKLPELDRWYREELGEKINRRRPAHLTHEELVRVTEWKMARGVWRGRNLALVRGNDSDSVVKISTAALAASPHPTNPISVLTQLAGVGPATASAVMAAAAPGTYPFFDDIVADQIPKLGEVAYTLGYYARYSSELRERASELGPDWNPALVERALWTNAGGKAGR